jgi:hypothetical protein
MAVEIKIVQDLPLLQGSICFCFICLCYGLRAGIQTGMKLTDAHGATG